MPTTATVEDGLDLQLQAKRVRGLSAAELDGLPAAAQRVLIDLVSAADAAKRADAGRAAEQGQADVEAARVAGLRDWDAFQPAASRPAPDPAVLADAVAGRPIARKVVVDAETDEWSLAVLTVRRRVEGGDDLRYPTASEYRAWSDERIAALRLEPEEWIAEVTQRDMAELADLDLDDEELRAIPGMEEPMDDPHPFNLAVERVVQAQQAHQQAEASRVMSALTAWRVAVEAAVGTPDAAENSLFKAAVMVQIAHGLKVAERTAATLVNSAEDLEQHVPTTWRLFRTGQVPWRAMQAVHAQMDGLDPALRPAYDSRAARIVATAPMPDVKQRLHEARERIQATTAVDRHEKALQGQRVELENLPDGMVALTNVMPAAEGILSKLALHEQAVAASKLPGETRSIAVLESLLLTDWLIQGARTDAPDGMDDVAVPGRKAAICKVAVLIPAMTALGHSDVPATLEGYGPIDIQTALALAGEGSPWIRVLTDPITGAVKDIGRKRYKPTAGMRALLGLLDRGARGPNGTRTSGRIEIDHVTPFRQHLARGRTAIDNLIQLAGRHHDLKTAGWIDIELKPGSRTLVWTDFAGNRITVPLEPLEPTPVPERFLIAEQPESGDGFAPF